MAHMELVQVVTEQGRELGCTVELGLQDTEGPSTNTNSNHSLTRLSKVAMEVQGMVQEQVFIRMNDS